MHMNWRYLIMQITIVNVYGYSFRSRKLFHLHATSIRSFYHSCMVSMDNILKWTERWSTATREMPNGDAKIHCKIVSQRRAEWKYFQLLIYITYIIIYALRLPKFCCTLQCSKNHFRISSSSTYNISFYRYSRIFDDFTTPFVSDNHEL